MQFAVYRCVQITFIVSRGGFRRKWCIKASVHGLDTSLTWFKSDVFGPNVAFINTNYENIVDCVAVSEMQIGKDKIIGVSYFESRAKIILLVSYK